MRILIVVLAVVTPVQAIAAATFSGTTTANFNVREVLDGTTTTATKQGVLSVGLTTDYSTMRWSLNWNVNLVISGGPTQSFETDLLANGSLESRRCIAGSTCLATNDPSPLSFPDGTGKAGAGSYILSGNAGWSLTDRIVTSTRTRTKPQAAILSSDAPPTISSPGNHYLTVANYPTNITLTPAFSAATSWEGAGGVWSSGNGTITLGRIVDGNNYLEVYLTNFLSSFTLTETLAGDFNDSHAVDGGDYVTWRKSVGPLSPFLTSYNAWRSNFGAGSGAGSAAAVPEPSIAAVLFTAVGLVFATRRRRK